MASLQGPTPSLRVVSDATLSQELEAQATLKAEAQKPPEVVMTSLVGHVRSTFEHFKRHRNNPDRGWNHRMVEALRAFNGTYDPVKLAKIQEFGGSDVYARIVAGKCRGAAALLRDIYLSPDRPWAIKPPEDPDVPPDVMSRLHQLAMLEAQALQAQGVPITEEMMRERVNQLADDARQAEKKHARDRAKLATARIDELLKAGGFYKAMSEFLAYLVMYPFAVLKGPVVRIVPTVRYQPDANGVVRAVTTEKARMCWNAVNPFDIWFTPGVSKIENATVIERTRFTRSELNDMLDLPGYETENVRAVLREYGAGGYTETADYTDDQRSIEESRETPTFNESNILEGLEYHGPIQGQMLIEMGTTTLSDPSSMGEITIDPIRDYHVQLWIIGAYAIKVAMSASPRKRHPYKATSFEKVPGAIVGHALPDILADVGDAANATLRALINNESMASGPQVVINTDRMSPGADSQSMFPWKHWYTQSDPLATNTQPPVDFFQPKSNAQELLTVYKELSMMADELSSIPRYQTGAGASGGAGRTASGLSMLMSNASKVLQTVAGNADDDVLEGTLEDMYDLLMLTDNTGDLRGDENISVLGVYVAQLREVQRSRQLEFLQITTNPLDASIMKPEGRAKVLRSVSQTIGLEGDEIVPDQTPEIQEAMPPQGGAPQQIAGPSGESQAAQAPRTNTTPGASGGGQTT